MFKVCFEIKGLISDLKVNQLRQGVLEKASKALCVLKDIRTKIDTKNSIYELRSPAEIICKSIFTKKGEFIFETEDTFLRDKIPLYFKQTIEELY